MQTGRLGGVAVLAVAVLVLAVGSALGRPDVVGVASAPPIDPPPQVGDCLYAGSEGPWGTVGADGEYHENPYTFRFAACREPWLGEVVAVRSRQDFATGPSPSAYGPGADEPCVSATAAFLGRPRYVDPVGVWVADGPVGGRFTPNPRQVASGQLWEACVLGPPAWTTVGAPVLFGPDQPQPRTTESQRGAWADATSRDRLGNCGDSRRGPEVFMVFCGSPHGTETLAGTVWPNESVTIDGSLADVLVLTCAAQAARMLQRSDPTAGGELAVDVWMRDYGGFLAVTPTTELPEHGFAECAIRPADPTRQLTASLVGLGEGPVPLTTN